MVGIIHSKKTTSTRRRKYIVSCCHKKIRCGGRYIFGGDKVAKLSVIQPIELLRVPVGRRGHLGRLGFRDLAHGAHQTLQSIKRSFRSDWQVQKNNSKVEKTIGIFSEQIFGDSPPPLEIFQYREAAQIHPKIHPNQYEKSFGWKWESHKEIQGNQGK